MATTTIRFGTPAFTKNGDVLTINYADGSTQDFESVTAFQAHHQNILNDFGEAGLKALAVVHLFASDPLMDSPSLWDNKEFTLTPESQNFAQVLRKV